MVGQHEQAHGAPRFNRRIPVSTYAIFLALFAVTLFITHLSFLRLPYFWDEAAQFVPAALDVYHGGFLVARSVTPNIHPPGVMLYLAGVWSATAFSPAATRSAMLILAAFGLLAAFLLAIELSKEARGMPAFLAVALLFVSPLFFAQSMLAQLDAPAMLFTTLALVWFLQDRLLLSAAASVVLVLTKETGLLVPLVFATWLARERRWREAGYFLAPVVALASWIAVLYSATGHWAGNAEFARFNLYFPLHPARIAAALVRRLYFLFVANFRWVGTVAVVTVWRHGRLHSRAWRVAFVLLAAHTALLCVCGGAVLERYLLPVMPVLFAAIAAALSLFRTGQRVVASLILLAASVAANFINPPYSFPLENNLAFTDFVRLQSDATDYLSHWYPHATVATAWPLTAELRSSELGYVTHRFAVRPLANFVPSTLESADWNRTGVVVVYSRSWDPPNSLLRLRPVRRFWERFYGFRPEVTMEQARARVPFPIEQHFERHGQWLDIYASPDTPRGVTTPVQTAVAPGNFVRRPSIDIPGAGSSYAHRRATETAGSGVGPGIRPSACSVEIPRCGGPFPRAKAGTVRQGPESKRPGIRR